MWSDSSIHFPRVRRWILAGTTLAVAVQGCDSSSPRSTPGSSPSVPVSRDAVIDFNDPVSPPSEPPELSLGRALFVVDTDTKSLYQFDLHRNRFLGPAPRMRALDLSIVTLPGYPTVISEMPPQGIALLNSTLMVAGGLDATVVALKLENGRIASKRVLKLPTQSIDSPSGRASSPVPWVVIVGSTPSGQLIAVADLVELNTTLAYIIDPATERVRVVKAFRGRPVSLVTDSRNIVLTTGEETLLVLDEELRLVRSISLEGVGFSTAIIGAEVLVGINDPARLIRVNLANGKTRVFSQAKAEISGPVISDSGRIWWVLPESGELRLIDSTGATLRTLVTCRGVRRLVASETMLAATCHPDDLLILVDPMRGAIHTVSTRGPLGTEGGFVSGLVLGPQSSTN
jgi:hypothetical protein